MNRRTALTLMAMGLLSLAVALPTGNAAAQQKGHVSYNVSAKDTTFTQQPNINVDDAPDHIVRALRVSSRLPQQRARDQWHRGRQGVDSRH